ncbi:MAG: hypothetical protein ACTS77_03500 [Arsenophonus sp. NC-TX2-MAG3]
MGQFINSRDDSQYKHFGGKQQSVKNVILITEKTAVKKYKRIMLENTINITLRLYKNHGEIINLNPG